MGTALLDDLGQECNGSAAITQIGRRVNPATGLGLVAGVAAGIRRRRQECVWGTVGQDGTMVHLLSAFAHQARVTLAQRQTGRKSNEITGFASLMEGLDLRGWVATMDALHTQCGHAGFLHGRGIEFVMIAKDNQPRLFDAIDAIAWEHTRCLPHRGTRPRPT